MKSTITTKNNSDYDVEYGNTTYHILYKEHKDDTYQQAIE